MGQAESSADRRKSDCESVQNGGRYIRPADQVSDDLTDWIDFVCDCRDEGADYQKYDLIMGKVANDKVFRVVDMYHSGIWDRDRALREIKTYPHYDQIAFITQTAIGKLLRFERSWEV